MKEITLTGIHGSGKFTFIDDDNYTELSKYTWFINNYGYVVRSGYKEGIKGVIWMHRQIMKPPIFKQIDHINGNKLDNRKENLRIVEFWQNRMNRGKYKNNTSGYKGVSKNKKLFRATIGVNNKKIHIGYNKDPYECAKMYDKAALHYFGEFARLNFA